MFITLEGIEGSGKTTQIELLATQLGRLGHEVLITREPGGCQLGLALRELLLDPSRRNDPQAELHLFLADRCQHISEVINPALERGVVVLCDRYADSTIAYQSAGRQLDCELVKRLAWLEGRAPVPQRTIILDMPPEAALARATERNRRINNAFTAFDNQALDFHRKVRAAFLEIAQTDPARVRVVDAAQPREMVMEECLQSLASMY